MDEDKDIGIIHITDLHFPADGSNPHWHNPFLRCLENLRKEKTLSLFAFAVTGDLVNDPNPEAFKSVENFLCDSLKMAGIIIKSSASDTNHEPKPDTNRLWIVEGNHDWKKDGWLWKTEKGGIPQETRIKCLREPFCDIDGRFVVVGMNTGREGKLARGRVLIKDLESIDTHLHGLSVNNYTYRIALLHHHLLPLPIRPPEWINKNLDKIMAEEAFKLLGNAGLVSSILTSGGINLVLGSKLN